MSGSSPTVELARCGTCHLRFVPADGVCPRCASAEVTTFRVPALATVLAATSIVYPSAGWPSPHRVALVELAEAVRLVAIADEPLPAAGEIVELFAGPTAFRVRRAP